DSETALLLKVHQSNFSIVGFTAAVGLKDLVELGRARGIPVMEDLGSGTFIDFSKYGLSREPTVQASVAAGVDVITFSGDKLLGGPQAGVIIGKKEILDRIKSNPLTRALRVDKMTLAGLEATLRLYRDEEAAVRLIPTMRMITLSPGRAREKAERLAREINALNREEVRVQLIDGASKTGGGALPLLDLPGQCVKVLVRGASANEVERFMRAHDPPIIGRIEEDAFVMDPRTIEDDEFTLIVKAVEAMLKKADL
ncbi:MAG: L-seryl-tRNA(Sec) selenium transferase, partial [Desulfobacterales bacterium]|nr:L-seryl-tRNA(Sec) selenium transferase [Desulfobacterales bacterium]